MKRASRILCMLLVVLMVFTMVEPIAVSAAVTTKPQITAQPASKTAYPGQTVKFTFPYVLTDTDYRFYMDGEPYYDFEYDDMKGFVFKFTMPDHDITLDFTTINSMEALVYPEE